MANNPLFKKICEKYGVSYVGYYDIPGRNHVEVFYQPNPRFDLGHSHYMGVIYHMVTGDMYICDAKRIEEAHYPAIQFEDGTILCSRYRHNYVRHGEAFLDGGIDYTRCNPNHMPNGYIVIRDGKEYFVTERNETLTREEYEYRNRKENDGFHDYSPGGYPIWDQNPFYMLGWRKAEMKKESEALHV